jgi:hypothetical protein
MIIQGYRLLDDCEEILGTDEQVNYKWPEELDEIVERGTDPQFDNSLCEWEVLTEEKCWDEEEDCRQQYVGVLASVRRAEEGASYDTDWLIL